ncbi:hypothetical protein QKW52_14240 [Bacillus sonorensis]|nr:hypothetical protein [Bacillus sonorensis]
MQQWIKEVARGKRGARDLIYEEARQAAEAIVAGQASAAQIAAFLIAERIKTESPEELLAFTEALRHYAEKLNLSKGIRERVIDFAGPYTGRHSFWRRFPHRFFSPNEAFPHFCTAATPCRRNTGQAVKRCCKSSASLLGGRPGCENTGAAFHRFRRG